MADERIDIDVSAALRDIAQLSSGLDGLQKKAKAAGTAFDDAFNADEAQGVADALQDLQKQYDSLKRSADVLKAANKNATNPDAIRLYTAQIAKLETGMRRLETAGKQAGVNLQKVNREAGTGRQVFENYFGAFTKATIIIAAIDAVRRFASEALNLAGQTAKAQKQFEAFTGSADKAKGIVADLTAFSNAKILNQQEVFQAGKALLAFGETSENLVPVLSRIADISRATGKDFGELTTIYGKARTAGVLYAEDINQLVDAGIPIIQEFAKQMGVSNDQVKKLASEGKISFEELQLAFFNLAEQGGKFADQAEAGIDAGDRFDAAWTEALTKVGTTLKPAWDAILNSLAGILQSVTALANSNSFSEFVAKSVVAASSLNPVLGSILRTLKLFKEETPDAFFSLPNAEEAKEQAEQRLAIEKAAEERRKELAKQSAKEAAARARQRAKELEQQERELQNLRFAAMKDGEEKEIALEQFRFSELKKQLDKYHIDTAQAEEQHKKNIREIVAKYAYEQVAIELEAINQIQAQNEARIQAEKDAVERERLRAEGVLKVRESEIDILEAQFDNYIKAMEANGAEEQEVARQQLVFDKRIAEERLRAKLALEESILKLTDASNTEEIALIKNRIALIKAELEGLTIDVPTPESGGGDRPGILEQLGFDDDQIAALQQGAQDVMSIISDVSDLAVQKADEQIRASQKQIAAAQEFYDEQKRLNEEGFANDLDLAERQLQAAKQQEEKAIAQKKKAQREQILIESALQAANIATAAAKTLKDFTGPQLPIGIALVAAMIGAFVAAKAKALQATKFREGGGGYVDGRGIIVGRSHEAGGVGFEAEGGEFFGTDGKRFGVVNKRMTAKHFDLLQAINLDDRARMADALRRLAPIDRESIAGAAGSSVTVISSGKDKDTYNLLKDWRNDEKRSTSITAAGGYLIERKGNVTRKIKIR